MLAQSAFLLALVPKQLRDGEPFERLLVAALMRGHHACKGRSHFRTQRHPAIALVGEVVKLGNDLFAALGRVEFQGFERWPVVFAKGITAGHRAPLFEDVITSIGAPGVLGRQRFWIEIAKARQTFHWKIKKALGNWRAPERITKRR